jgi:hypothetical protein
MAERRLGDSKLQHVSRHQSLVMNSFIIIFVGGKKETHQ